MRLADCRLWVAWISDAPARGVYPQFAARIMEDCHPEQRFSRLRIVIRPPCEHARRINRSPGYITESSTYTMANRGGTCTAPGLLYCSWPATSARTRWDAQRRPTPLGFESGGLKRTDLGTSDLPLNGLVGVLLREETKGKVLQGELVGKGISCG